MIYFKEVLNEISTNELEKLVKNNISLASNIRKEIQKLDELNEPIKFESKTKINNRKLNTEEFPSDFSEYEYYYENLKNVPIGTDLEQLKKIIKENLPSKKNCNYFNIILYIKYKIDEEILTYVSLIEQCNSIGDISTINDIKVCIEYLKIKLSLIDKIDYEIKNNDDNLEQNKIIFLHSNAGNNYSISDLEGISEDYYDGIKELYESIKNNTFKGVKRFSGNNERINGVSEVKYNLIRIIFDRLDENTYIILQILIKKTQNDSGYLNTVSTRFSKYNKKEVILSLNDNNFMEENRYDVEKFEKILNKRGKNKVLC